MNKIRIAGAIASKTGITLYLEDGKEMNLPNGSWRTQAILDEVLKPLARNKIVTLDLDDFSVEGRIEKKTGGFIKFLRNTAAKIGSALGITHDGGVTEDAGLKPNELVAVVNGKRIPGVEALEKQMERAAFGDNIEGFQRFMERLAAIIDKRGHTVDELLNFMKRGDLPIANDGSIIAYKVLRSKGDRYVDCHSGNVTQRLGSEVSMIETLVDPSRRTQCSSGLHVARRGYLAGFSGDIITLIKIAPEDVVAVPEGEPDKMRVRAYHIVAVLPDEVHSILRSNKPMTTNVQASKILADAIAGNHIGIIERVVIGAAYGGKVTVTPVGGAAPAPIPLQSGQAIALDGNTLTKSVREIKHEIAEAVEEKQAEVEDARERANRRKREKRAAARAERDTASSVEQSRAEVQQLVNEPVETAAQRSARRKREKRAALKAEQNVVSAPPAKKERAKSAFEKKSAPKSSEVLDPRDRAVNLVRDGMSVRAAERATGVSARTISRLLKNK